MDAWIFISKSMIPIIESGIKIPAYLLLLHLHFSRINSCSNNKMIVIVFGLVDINSLKRYRKTETRISSEDVSTFFNRPRRTRSTAIMTVSAIQTKINPKLPSTD